MSRIPGWSDRAWALWGKLSREDGSYLPLVVHLEDTAAVADHLWDHWIPRIVRRRVAAELGGTERLAKSLFAWVASVHDLGKAAPAFAGKARLVGAEHVVYHLEKQGLSCPDVPRDDYAHHGVMGHFLLQEWLTTTRSVSRPVARSLATVIGGHHGTPPTGEALSRLRNNRDPRRGSRAWGGPAWDDVRHEILTRMFVEYHLDEILAALPPKGLSTVAQVDLSAALIAADWIASDEKTFPYDGLDDGDLRRSMALGSLTLPPPWHPPPPPTGDPAALLATRFPHLAGYPIRPVQQEAMTAAAEVDEAPLIVVEAAMGQGKTEAALQAAEILAAEFGCGGVFVALPTMATSDAMFTRVLTWLRHLPGQSETSVFLAHSKSGLNDDYRGLLRDSYARFNGVYDDDLNMGSASAERLAPVADTWLQGRKRGVLANHVIGTVDQVLFAGLQTKHLALRHLALSGKVVIVDEVHAADDYMRSYLCRVLTWLGAYGAPVVLLSATLPSAQRRQLVDAYVRGRRGRQPKSERSERVEIPEPSTYPCLTVATTHVRTVAITDTAEPVPVALSVVPDDELLPLLRRELVDGGCAAVIRNTVGRAQNTFEELREEFGEEVLLVHSRFIGPDRMRLERKIRELLGPPGGVVSRPQRCIVVGTQVLEQSLDVDFDVMFSDIAPIDLLLQRTGRLHRHRRAEMERPAALRRPHLYLTGVSGVDPQGGPPLFDRGCVAVYGEYRLLRAVAVLLPQLCSGQEILLPPDIPTLVQSGYVEHAEPPPGWSEAWEAARRKYAAIRADSTKRAEDFQVTEPMRSLTLIDWLTSPVRAEGDDLDRCGKAQVRDSSDSLEVILLSRSEQDGLLHVLPDVPEEAGAALPTVLGSYDDRVARAAASCTVRLPRTLVHPGVIDQVIAELEQVPEVVGWQDNRWLAGQLVLPLDDSLQTVLCGRRVRYDRLLGLLVSAETSDRK
ncbi:CRISPR-associated helicase Cas3' [Austwickia chelonae]|uniref:CRISPR-associated helicase Cas3' n=1 Tax=Austwickia chelonae TaxID=100225 RepID=UPI0013C31645|nr:CRISPR-associated helicase Cas3' [Austwickia chelonae]